MTRLAVRLAVILASAGLPAFASAQALVFNPNGVDAQCGAATHASVVGMASPTPNGWIGLGLTIACWGWPSADTAA
jgi:hypothetical protein